MVDRAAARPPADERGPDTTQAMQVDLLPGVLRDSVTRSRLRATTDLVAADHDAWRVAIEEKHGSLWIRPPEEPGVVGRLNHSHWPQRTSFRTKGSHTDPCTRRDTRRAAPGLRLRRRVRWPRTLPRGAVNVDASRLADVVKARVDALSRHLRASLVIASRRRGAKLEVREFRGTRLPSS